ncbi:MAG: tRNA (N6-isopentenyl adenosine(37)-C2)-methylthiotransferase MiaB [Deltaproteobacteria bacterium]|nr:MAG: tRNA (N6-isopentenyl adenosine(37)-C2)-methylthiotransferase MiaB [Deltaproteobacteria bacterium]
MKSVNIYTLGCQMNVYDSEQILRLLSSLGYENEEEPENADLIILNTCSIRQKAADKAFSFLGRIKKRKETGAGVVIGVGGCVAQQEGRQILKRAPYVDFVFGTGAIHRLPEIVKRAESGEKLVDIDDNGDIIEPGTNGNLPDTSGSSGFVSIMRGCDNFCTYCIVPFVRGREHSRPAEDIIYEIKRRAKKGMCEVTLLGQNVNSYGSRGGDCDFADLLYMVAEIKDIRRIRFATSHPKDLSDKLINCFSKIDKLCRHFHIPVQSGSNSVLKKMNRKYTREHYLERINSLRKVCPDIELSTDIIAGFPGETESDFYETCDLVEQVGYDSVFAFAYSDRPGTRASSYPMKLSVEEKKKRLNEILNIQNRITRLKNNESLGKKLEILVEKVELKQDKDSCEGVFISGRSFGNRIVHIRENPEKYEKLKAFKGRLVYSEITEALGHSLKGRLA